MLRILLIVGLCMTCLAGASWAEVDGAPAIVEKSLSAKELWLKRFPYVGRWHGPKGVGTAVLISPTWCLTAKHVAVRKIADSSIPIEIRFGDKSVSVAEAFAAPEGDIALVRLAKPIDLKPVKLFGRMLTDEDLPFEFAKVGGTSGAHCGMPGAMKETKVFLEKAHRKGKGGDSGGAWVVEGSTVVDDVQIGILHGGGIGYQPASVRAWIDKTMDATGEVASWVLAFPEKSAETQE